MVKESETTRGMSLRELVLEMREDLKKQNERIGKRPTRTELYGTLAAGVSILGGIIALL